MKQNTQNKDATEQFFFDFVVGQFDLPLFTKIDAPIKGDYAKENQSVVQGVASPSVRKD